MDGKRRTQLLRNELKTYHGPVFAGIKKFGYRSFPKGKGVYFNSETSSVGLDGYFKDKVASLIYELNTMISSKS